MTEKLQAGPVGPARQACTEGYENSYQSRPPPAPPPTTTLPLAAGAAAVREGWAWPKLPSSSGWSLKQPGRDTGSLTASTKARAAC